MPGTKAGGVAARNTNLEKTEVMINGELVTIEKGTFYAVVGAKGGKQRVPKGFAVRRDLVHEAGKKGGSASKRRKATDETLA